MKICNRVIARGVVVAVILVIASVGILTARGYDEIRPKERPEPPPSEPPKEWLYSDIRPISPQEYSYKPYRVWRYDEIRPFPNPDEDKEYIFR